MSPNLRSDPPRVGDKGGSETGGRACRRRAGDRTSPSNRSAELLIMKGKSQTNPGGVIRKRRAGVNQGRQMREWHTRCMGMSAWDETATDRKRGEWKRRTSRQGGENECPIKLGVHAQDRAETARRKKASWPNAGGTGRARRKSGMTEDTAAECEISRAG